MNRTAVARELLRLAKGLVSVTEDPVARDEYIRLLSIALRHTKKAERMISVDDYWSKARDAWRVVEAFLQKNAGNIINGDRKLRQVSEERARCEAKMESWLAE